MENQWYAVMLAREVPQKRPVAARRLGQNMVFFRDLTGSVACIADRCCHRGASLGCGRLVEGTLECPFHGFRFDKHGKVTLIPALGRGAAIGEQFKVKSYPVREKRGFIFLWWGEQRPVLPEIDFFEDIGDDFVTSTICQHSPVHYSRAVENQLDVAHLPFVHKTTIGRGNRTLVHGPVVVSAGGRLKFYVCNEVDGPGKRALAPDEIKDHPKLPMLQFIFPNLWQNYLSERFRVLAAFVPVDDENTLVYVSSCQSFVRAPFLRHLVGWINNRINTIILNQDRRVVITQRPVATQLHMEEKLIPADRPIVAYRRLRCQPPV